MDGVVVGRFRVWPLAVRLSAGTDLEHGYRPGHAAIQIQTPGVESEGRRSKGMSETICETCEGTGEVLTVERGDIPCPACVGRELEQMRAKFSASEQQCAALIASEAHARERVSELEQANAAATFPERFAVWKALGFPDGHDGDLVAAARKLKEDHDSLAETAKDADKQLVEAVKQRNALGVRVAELEKAKPKCPDCNSVGMSHCSDPENCGGLYWPDRMYRDLEARNAVLTNALARAHACATLREDGTCDGCFVSAALATPAPEKQP
jgi:hypothetical protein